MIEMAVFIGSSSRRVVNSPEFVALLARDIARVRRIAKYRRGSTVQSGTASIRAVRVNYVPCSNKCWDRPSRRELQITGAWPLAPSDAILIDRGIGMRVKISDQRKPKGTQIRRFV